MFRKKSLLVPTAFALFAFIGVTTANAGTTPCYTVASLQGQYAITGTYGANVAIALAMRYFDGKGNLTGTFIVNEPTPGSSTGERTIVTERRWEPTR